MPLISVEEVVKTLSEVDFDESKMDLSSPIPIEPYQAVAEQQIKDVIQIQNGEKYMTEAATVTGLEMAK